MNLHQTTTKPRRTPLGDTEHLVVCYDCDFREKALTHLEAQARGQAHGLDPDAHKRRMRRVLLRQAGRVVKLAG